MTRTLADLIAAYVQDYRGRDETLPDRLAWWNERLGKTKLWDLHRAQIAEAVRELEQGPAKVGARGQGVRELERQRSPATVVNRYIANLSSVFRWGIEHEWISENPVRGIRRRKENHDGIGNPLGFEEAQRLLAACRNSSWDRLYVLVLMALTTGARRGELLAIRWRDLDFKANKVLLRNTKNGRERSIPLVAEVVAELKGLVRPLDPEALVFGRPNDPSKPFEFRKHWLAATQAAGVAPRRLHDCRHSVGHLLTSQGKSLAEVA
jgi:integrase